MTSPVTIATGLSGDGAYLAALDALVRDRVASRVFTHDATLWGPDAEAEASIRLGWTDFAETARGLIPEIAALRAEFAEVGVDRFVLCGMGGSSLAPEVITRWAGVELTMLDSTHPDAVRRALAGDLARTAVVVSSKSGGTIETRSHLAAFDQAFRDAGIAPEQRIVIVTDPGSPLEEDSRAAGRRVFNADPNVGGRFSALTAFGLVPSGLAGADLDRLVDDAQGIREALAQDSAENPALVLAAAVAAGLPGRSVLGVRADADADWSLGSWIEQLVAESTGKDGRGVLPIALDAAAPEFSDAAPSNLLPVSISAQAPNGAPEQGVAVGGALGAQFLLWEAATAALGRLMEIDPFNQPDVESAKVAARAALADAAGAGPEDVRVPTFSELLEQIRAGLPEGGYVAIQAFLDPQAAQAPAVQRLRDRLAAALGAPVALGWGPRYLHSTGQLHKGGPETGVYLQLLDASPEPLSIPGSESGFDALIAAQARGDRDVLAERGRPVVRIVFGDADAELPVLAAGD